MSKTKKAAFFAPIKPPDHPIPSGDRLIARNLIKALTYSGHEVELVSRYICYSKRSGVEILAERKKGALEEVERILLEYGKLECSELPDVWMTYHPYCKAPDWIGPIVSRELGIPYVTVEAAKTGQGGPDDEWSPWRTEAQAGIKAADLHLVFKPTDRVYLTDLLGDDTRLRDIPPFMDTDIPTVEPMPLPAEWKPQTPVLITTGMMRKGKKDKNFYMLAEILAGLTDNEWNFIVVGGGPEEENIREAFSRIPAERMHWTGQVEHTQVLRWMKASDVFLWPGWKEPIGMVYLEAQLQGLPVIAYQSMGVPLVVEQGETGLLAPEDHSGVMRENARRLLADSELLGQMGKAAKKKVLEQHSIEAAAERLGELLSEVI
ncbi:MAG: glycosyltransferase family 4 protein [Pseudomonadota bacterium]